MGQAGLERSNRGKVGKEEEEEKRRLGKEEPAEEGERGLG